MTITRTKLTIAAMAAFLNAALGIVPYFIALTMSALASFRILDGLSPYMLGQAARFLFSSMEYGQWLCALIAVYMLVKLLGTYRPGHVIVTFGGLYLVAFFAMKPLSQLLMVSGPNGSLQQSWILISLRMLLCLITIVFGMMLFLERLPLFQLRTIGLFMVLGALVGLASNIGSYFFALTPPQAGDLPIVAWWIQIITGVLGSICSAIAKILMGLLFLKAPTEPRENGLKEETA